MATWDSPDLLARVKRLALRPAVDEDRGPTDADVDTFWYALLTEAQTHWHGQFSIHFPGLLFTAPTKLVTADGGLTYQFPNNVVPSKVEVYDAPDGMFLVPGFYDDPNADYVWEGKQIRFPRGKTRTFADGPYARYIVPPDVISAAVAPVLQPEWARILLPPRACIISADRGGLGDPAPYENQERKLWYGDPERGDFGILGVLKTQNPFAGAAAVRRPGVAGFAYLSQTYTPR